MTLEIWQIWTSNLSKIVRSIIEQTLSLNHSPMPCIEDPRPSFRFAAACHAWHKRMSPHMAQ